VRAKAVFIWRSQVLLHHPPHAAKRKVGGIRNANASLASLTPLGDDRLQPTRHRAARIGKWQARQARGPATRHDHAYRVGTGEQTGDDPDWQQRAGPEQQPEHGEVLHIPRAHPADRVERQQRQQAQREADQVHGWKTASSAKPLPGQADQRDRRSNQQPAVGHTPGVQVVDDYLHAEQQCHQGKKFHMR